MFTWSSIVAEHQKLELCNTCEKQKTRASFISLACKFTALYKKSYSLLDSSRM